MTSRRSCARDEEAEQHPKRRRGHYEEVNGDQILQVVVQERAPSLRGGLPSSRHQARHGALGHLDAKLEQLAVDARGALQGVGNRHRPDQRTQFGVNARATPEASRSARPIPFETLPEPADDGFRLNQDQRVLPPIPALHEPHPEEPIGRRERRLLYPAPQDRDLLAKCEILQGQVAAVPESGAEGRDEGLEDVEHSRGRFIGSSRKVNVSREIQFWQRTGNANVGSVYSCKRESFEVLRVRANQILQNRDCDLFAEPQARHVIRSIVDARPVAAQGNVEGKFVDFRSHGRSVAQAREQGEAVRARHDAAHNLLRAVEKHPPGLAVCDGKRPQPRRPALMSSTRETAT